jgi:hypothetical protein
MHSSNDEAFELPEESIVFANGEIVTLQSRSKTCESSYSIYVPPADGHSSTPVAEGVGRMLTEVFLGIYIASVTALMPAAVSAYRLPTVKVATREFEVVAAEEAYGPF